MTSSRKDHVPASPHPFPPPSQSEYPSEFWRNAALIRDFVFACPSRRLARALDARQLPVWSYHFAPRYCRAPSVEDLSWVDFQLLHCYHTSELYAVWGHAWPEVPGVRALGPRMRRVSRYVQSFWGAFVKTGDPNGGGAGGAAVAAYDNRTALTAEEEEEEEAKKSGLFATWPRYRPAARPGENEQTLILAETLAAETGYRGGICDQLDELCGDNDCFGPKA